MDYLDFVILFLIIPSAVLGWALYLRFKATGFERDHARSIFYSFLVISVIAVVYTTPWDNYLVAERVWWYDPEKILGIIWGWVPIEEYAFFVLHVIFTGLGAFLILRPSSTQLPDFSPNRSSGLIFSRGAVLLGLLWIISATAFLLNISALRYLTLILLWGIPPLMIHITFGGDILWHRRRRTAILITVFTLYFIVVDTIAIREGIWTINPNQSTNIMLPGGLPIEEAVFFLVTNTLIGFSMALWSAKETWIRLNGLILIALSKIRRPVSERF